VISELIVEMRVRFVWVGKSGERWLAEGVDEYLRRLKHYVSLSVDVIMLPKNMPKNDVERLKGMEGEAILGKIAPSDDVYLLDERGQEYTSEELANFFQKKMSASVKSLVIVIGGAYGFSEKMYKRANGMISFSKMTFSHQIVRLILCEQVYRAFTILRGEGYHH